MWWLLIGYMTGRGLSNAALPETVKQERYDRAVARREARRAARRPGQMTVGQWVAVVFASLFVVLYVIGSIAG